MSAVPTLAPHAYAARVRDAHTELLSAVAARLNEADVLAAPEWPGALSIHVTSTVTVWTGLTGWDYGTVNRLTPAHVWEPDDTLVATVDVPQDCTDPVALADAWATWVHTYRTGE